MDDSVELLEVFFDGLAPLRVPLNSFGSPFLRTNERNYLVALCF